jgi:lysophospholipase L1-like esterase
MSLFPLARPVVALVVAGVAVLAVAGTALLSRGEGAGDDATVVPARPDEPGQFRLSVTEGELAALILEGARNSAAPLAEFDLDIEGPDAVRFAGRLDGNRLGFEGRLGLRVVDGRLDLRVLSARVGFAPLPGVARKAIEDLVARTVDFDAALATQGIALRAVSLGGDTLTFEGAAVAPGRVSWKVVRDALRHEASRRDAARGPAPQERLGRGIVDALSAPGEPVYLALGDSLARGSRLRDLRDGYVSRLHHQLSQRDGVSYGLENLAVGGETSASFLRRQLPAALEALRTRRVAYVTLDLGGNDLLGALRSSPCADGLARPPCRARLDRTVAAYLSNLDAILNQLRAAAPTTEIVFLTTYNPFSLGLDTPFERESDAALRGVNTDAAAVAARYDVRVADGFAALAGTTSATTGMRQHPPDVHPRPLGHDLLAAAVLDALAS